MILNANPVKGSFCEAIAQKYNEEAKSAGHETALVNIGELEFNPNLSGGFKSETPLEDTLKKQQELILWSNHIVIVSPNWWSGVPAIFKGYIDRVFLPDFAFSYKSNGMVDGLLKGKSARVFITQDSPYFWTRLVMGDPFWRMLNKGVLAFCGISPSERTTFTMVRKSTDTQRDKWLKEVCALAAKGA